MTNKEYYKHLNEFIDSIPNQYNQIMLMKELFNNDLDYYISISTRTDGKSYNYIAFLLSLSIKFDIKFLAITRHYTLRKSLEELIFDIMKTHTYFKDKEYALYTRRTDDYIAIGIDNKDICCISDLNNASDLKLRSSFLKQFEIIAYDEFLTLPEDYAGDEYQKLKTIYQSMDRQHKTDKRGEIQLMHPKILLLGNAVNFDSPILAQLDIFEKLENFKINSIRKFDNIIIEMRKNENTNKKRNLRAFANDGDESMDNAQFNFNRYKLASKGIKKDIMKNFDEFVIQDKQVFIQVRFSPENFKMILKVIPFSYTPYYTTTLNNQSEKCKFLNENYFNPLFIKKHENNDLIYYENSYTKNYILNNLPYLNLFLLCKRFLKDNEVKHVDTEKTFKENYKERSIKKLIESMM